MLYYTPILAKFHTRVNLASIGMKIIVSRSYAQKNDEAVFVTKRTGQARPFTITGFNFAILSLKERAPLYWQLLPVIRPFLMVI